MSIPIPVPIRTISSRIRIRDGQSRVEAKRAYAHTRARSEDGGMGIGGVRAQLVRLGRVQLGEAARARRVLVAIVRGEARVGGGVGGGCGRGGGGVRVRVGWAFGVPGVGERWVRLVDGPAVRGCSGS